MIRLASTGDTDAEIVEHDDADASRRFEIPRRHGVSTDKARCRILNR